MVTQYLSGPVENPVITLRDAENNHIATASCNAEPVLPLSKKSLTCQLGNSRSYGGWARSTLAVEALNIISKVSTGGRCQFKLESGSVLGEVTHSNAMPPLPGGMHFTQPLVSCVAMAAAVGGGIQGSRVLDELADQLPNAALQSALQSTEKTYENATQLAQAQTRNQMCSSRDPGYQPADMSAAAAQLQSEAPYVLSSLGSVLATKPLLAGTNVSYTEMATAVQAFGQIKKEAEQLLQTLKPSDVHMALSTRKPPDMTMVHAMQGLRTYPYVASARALKPLQRSDRANFIVSSQIMAGGMGSVYTHDLRQRGLSYRPAGQACLAWHLAG